MRTLSAAGILEAWERGSSQVPAEQALMLLAAACPERTGDELAALPLGTRDALLLTARQRLFGAELTSFARCPVCASALEFTAQVDDLRAGPRVDETPSAISPPFHTTMLPAGSGNASVRVTYRLPTGGDLVALQDISEPAAFRLALVGRCVLEAMWGGAAVAPSEMSARDPQAEVLLDLTCPACGASWQTVFDIAAYFWAELTAEAKRLLREVDALARAYGWREVDILALSPGRRQAYLELVWTF